MHVERQIPLANHTTDFVPLHVNSTNGVDSAYPCLDNPNIYLVIDA